MSRLIRAVFSLALAGLLTHCAASSGAGGSSAAGGLRFAWPDGLTLKVSSTSTTTEDGQPPEQSGLDYQLRLEGQGEERKLITEQLTPAEAGAPPDEGMPPSLPTIILGPKGELRRVEGIDAVVQEMVQEAESQGIPKEQQEQITGLVRDAMERAARSQWELLVGKWSGLSLKPGESVERKGQVTVPLFGSTAATREKVSLKEYVPCTEGAAEKRCVRLVLESTLDPEGLERSRAELLRQLKATMKANMGLPDPAIPEMSVVKLRVDSTLEFITEPETLVPHFQRSVTSSQVVLQEEEGEQKKFESQSEHIDRFTAVAR
jgi:hypothetical protein